jgi:hypothetical protein
MQVPHGNEMPAWGGNMGEYATCLLDPLLTLQSTARPMESGYLAPSVLLPAHRTESKTLAGKLPFSNSHLCIISRQKLKATESVNENQGGKNSCCT